MKLNRFWINQIPAIMAASAIFVQSSIPGNELPKLEVLSHDKIIHIAIYFILAFALFHALFHQTKFLYLKEHWLICGVLMTTLFAISDETHQFFTPNRSSEIWDLNADILGIAIAGFLFWKFPTKAL